MKQRVSNMLCLSGMTVCLESTSKSLDTVIIAVIMTADTAVHPTITVCAKHATLCEQNIRLFAYYAMWYKRCASIVVKGLQSSYTDPISLQCHQQAMYC